MISHVWTRGVALALALASHVWNREARGNFPFLILALASHMWTRLNCWASIHYHCQTLPNFEKVMCSFACLANDNLKLQFVILIPMIMTTNVNEFYIMQVESVNYKLQNIKQTIECIIALDIYAPNHFIPKTKHCNQRHILRTSHFLLIQPIVGVLLGTYPYSDYFWDK